MTNTAMLAARFARRPLLLEPGAADALLRQLALGDPRGMHSESRLEAVLRKIGVGRRISGAYDKEPPTEADDVSGPICYAPLWAQQAYGEPQDEGFAWSLYEGIALMECSTAISDRGEEYCGVWYHGYDTLLAGMREALADERVRGLFVRMRTPGGVVDGGIYALTAFLRQARASAGGKPIHFYCDMACSAGFWIVANGDRSVAPPPGLVGSAGVVIVHEDWSENFKRQGVIVTPITFGAKKVDGAPWAPLSAEARADWQSEVDQIGRDFIAGVVAGRPSLTEQALIDTQAGVFMAENADPARSALSLGLIDAVMTEEEAFAELLERVSSTKIANRSIEPSAAAATAPRQSQKEAENPMIKLPKVISGRPEANAVRAEAAPTPEATEAEAGVSECATCDGTGEVDDEPCPDCGGTGEEIIDQGERQAAQPTEASAAAPDLARAIATSAEGKANPSAALAAIAAGLTLEQFKAMSAVQPAATGLDRRMAGARRLGADGIAPDDGKTAMGSALVADAKARRSAREA